MTASHRRRRDPASTDLILGLTVVVVIAVIGWIAYNALSGLPLQSRYHVAVALPNADRLLATNDVRIGGVRVGQVDSVEAEPRGHGLPARSIARLSIDRDVGPLPVDSLVKVRPASVLGATYVELTRGSSARTVADGGALGLGQARAGVDLTDLLDVFDRSARKNFRDGVYELSDGLAGRGQSLNLAIQAVRRLLPPLERVMRVVGGRRAHLEEFFPALDTFTSALRPVSEDLAGLVAGGARTFAALSEQRPALVRAIGALPSAEAATTRAFTSVRPGLRGLAALARDLRPAGASLAPALTGANAALTAGIEPLRDLPPLGDRLQDTLRATNRLVGKPATDDALRKLTPLLDATNGVLVKLAPAQVYCNVISLGTQNFSSYIGTVGTGHGPSFWNFGISTFGAATDSIQAAEPAPDLNANYTPNENAEECEAGNEPAQPHRVLDNPPGLQSRSTRKTLPPPGARERAVAAGIIPGGSR